MLNPSKAQVPVVAQTLSGKKSFLYPSKTLVLWGASFISFSLFMAAYAAKLLSRLGLVHVIALAISGFMFALSITDILFDIYILQAEIKRLKLARSELETSCIEYKNNPSESSKENLTRKKKRYLESVLSVTSVTFRLIDDTLLFSLGLISVLSMTAFPNLAMWDIEAGVLNAYLLVSILKLLIIRIPKDCASITRVFVANSPPDAKPRTFYDNFRIVSCASHSFLVIIAVTLNVLSYCRILELNVPVGSICSFCAHIMSYLCCGMAFYMCIAKEMKEIKDCDINENPTNEKANQEEVVGKKMDIVETIDSHTHGSETAMCLM